MRPTPIVVAPLDAAKPAPPPVVLNPDALSIPLPSLSRFAERPELREQARRAAALYAGIDRDERMAMAVALRAAGASPRRIAMILSCSVHTVRDYLAKAREWGALDDVVRDIDFRHVPQAVENLGQLLEAGDKDVTLAVLKGRGIFRTYGNTKQEGVGPGAGMNLSVAFINAPTNPLQGPIVAVQGSTGEIVGAPND